LASTLWRSKKPIPLYAQKRLPLSWLCFATKNARKQISIKALLMWHLSLKKENKAFLEYKKKSASNTLPTNDYLDKRLGIFPCL
jgi:hypothetical protein